VKKAFHSIAIALFHLGGLGLLIVGVLDSSFLTMPLANDLLVVALSASHHHRFLYYALMAAAGSTAGCAVVDVAGRKVNEKVQEKVSSKRLKFVESHIRKHAGAALAIAAVIPPPFPFTPFVAAAAAAQFPRQKLLAIVSIARFVRFAADGALAIFFGNKILSLAKSPPVEDTIIALIVIAVGGSVVSIARWIRKARRTT